MQRLFWSHWPVSTAELQIGITPLRTVSARLFNGRENSPGVELEKAEPPIRETVETSPGVEVDGLQKVIEVQAQEPIGAVSETSPGVEVDPLDDVYPKCSDCFGDGYIEDEFGPIEFCQCETEARLSRKKTQRAIAPAAKNSINAGSHPTLTGIALSDRFVAR